MHRNTFEHWHTHTLKRCASLQHCHSDNPKRHALLSQNVDKLDQHHLKSHSWSPRLETFETLLFIKKKLSIKNPI